MPVWREVLADLETPVAAFAKLVGDGPGFLLESVEHGERWSRCSLRRPRPGGDARCCATARSRRRRRRCPPAVPLDRGHARRARGAARASTGRRCIADLPPLHGGVMGYLGYDVVREVERLPDVPARRPRPARRGAERHRHAGRVRPLAPAGLPDRERARARSSTDAELDGAYDAADRPRRAGRRRPRPAARRTCRSTPPRGRRRAARRCARTMADGMYQQAVEVAKEHILAGDIFQVVLRSASTSTSTPTRSTSTGCCARSTRARTCTSCAIPSVTIVGSSPEPMVQLLDGKVISPADRRHPPPRPRPRSDDRRMAAELTRAPEGARRARHAGRPRPQRRRPGRASSAPSRSTS